MGQTLHKMEMARVRFLISAYLRIRLAKIEKHVFHPQHVKDTRKLQLQAWLCQEVNASVGKWAAAAKAAGSVESAGDVLSPELQSFLDARELDRQHDGRHLRFTRQVVDRAATAHALEEAQNVPRELCTPPRRQQHR